MNFRIGLMVVASVASATLASCGNSQILGVDNAEVTLPANEGDPMVGTFTLRGGQEDTALVSVTSKQADTIEMVETNADGTTQAIDKVDIAAGENIDFEKGGKHIVITGVNEGVIKKGEMKLTVKFANGEIYRIPAEFEQAGD